MCQSLCSTHVTYYVYGETYGHPCASITNIVLRNWMRFNHQLVQHDCWCSLGPSVDVEWPETASSLLGKLAFHSILSSSWLFNFDPHITLCQVTSPPIPNCVQLWIPRLPSTTRVNPYTLCFKGMIRVVIIIIRVVMEPFVILT